MFFIEGGNVFPLKFETKHQALLQVTLIPYLYKITNFDYTETLWENRKLIN